jgi:hypothetical protein
VKEMTLRMWILGVGVASILAVATPAEASSPTASCIGQQLSVYGPTYGADLGAAVSYEARNPQVLGTSNLGGWTSGAARAPRDACPVD